MSRRAPERGIELARLAWPEVRPKLKTGAAAVLPVGSAAKEHGRHLPLNTDFLQAAALGRALAERSNVLVWPTLGYGFYPAFTRYPGSTSVGAIPFRNTVHALVLDMERAGAQRVLVINTGISTLKPIEAALGNAPNRAVVHVYGSENHHATKASVCEQPRGGHADEAETSVMLHVAPEMVRLDLASPWTKERKPGPFEPFDSNHPGFSPDGVYGDPTLATAEKGRQLFEAMVSELVAALER